NGTYRTDRTYVSPCLLVSLSPCLLVGGRRHQQREREIGLRRDPAGETSSVNESGKPVVAQETRDRENHLQTLRVREDVAQRQFEQSILKRRAATGLLFQNRLARRFEQRSVADSRRAGRFAGAAAQAEIDVALEAGGIGVEPALGDGAHQKDSPARAVVFIAELLVGRAGGQAESAVNAAQQFLRFGAKRDLKGSDRVIHQ